MKLGSARTNVCARCGVTYEVRRGGRIYCSFACYFPNPKPRLKNCATCGRALSPKQYKFCSMACVGANNGRLKRQLPSRQTAHTEIPTTLDIAWAAGVYEGEGNCAGGYGRGFSVTVVQKDDWLVRRLQALFGGSVYFRNQLTATGLQTHRHTWYLSGSLARDFIPLIYPYLSPRRKAQVDRAKSYEAKLGVEWESSTPT